MKDITELIEKFKNSTSIRGKIYTDEQINSIVLNCISISKTWFDNNKNVEGESYELLLCNEDGDVEETLHGVTPDVLPEAMLDVIGKNDGSCSTIVLNSYLFTNGRKTIVHELGKMDIS
jgi:hypothetical protein